MRLGVVLGVEPFRVAGFGEVMVNGLDDVFVEREGRIDRVAGPVIREEEPVCT